MRVISTVLALAVSLVLVGSLSATEEKKGPKHKHPRGPMVQRWEMFRGLNLTEDQKSKMAELRKEYGSKFKEAWKKMDTVLTEEQRTARTEAMKVAKEAGEKTREAWKKVKDAVKLTDVQKTKMAELRKETGALHKELREKMAALLTPEQKEKCEKHRKCVADHAPKAGRKHHGGPEHRGMGWGRHVLEGLDLTDDQKTRLKELRKEYGSKMKEAWPKMEGLLTEEQKKARAGAIEAAKAAGKEGKEVWKDVKEAVKLTDDQKTKMAEAREAAAPLRKELREKVLAILTPEQQAQLKEKRQHGKGHQPADK